MSATIAILYPQGKYDLEYYESVHMPLLVKEWTQYGFRGYRIVQIQGTADPSQAAPYQALVLLEFDKGEDFQAAMTAPSAPQVLGDMVNFTDVSPTLLVGGEVASWKA